MPCNSDGYELSREEILGKHLQFVTAALCAFLRARKGDDFPGIDWKEAGITKGDLLNWWDNHQAADDKRRKHEQQELALAEERGNALNKLSKRERALLGIKS